MASSFHWANFDNATKEFHRVLVNDGVFCALWNPRYIFNNPILVDIENKITELNPDIKRVSSGKSDFVENLLNLESEEDLEEDQNICGLLRRMLLYAKLKPFQCRPGN